MHRDWSNEIGKKYGHLTIVEIPGYSQPGDGIVCRAICDCPDHTEVIVPIKRIVYGRKISCGCSNCVDLLGQRFGRLIVIAKTDARYNRQVVWQCKCDCGNVAVVASDSLRRGMTRSCGCLGDETRQKNCIGHKTNIVMGTNVARISRDDHNPMASNTSGHTGVSYNPDRGVFEASLEFRRQRYLTRHTTFEEAVKSRTEMKQIHNDFVDWWNGLDASQQAANRLAYDQMAAEKQALLRSHCDHYSRTNDEQEESCDEVFPKDHWRKKKKV